MVKQITASQQHKQVPFVSGLQAHLKNLFHYDQNVLETVSCGQIGSLSRIFVAGVIYLVPSEGDLGGFTQLAPAWFTSLFGVVYKQFSLSLFEPYCMLARKVEDWSGALGLLSFASCMWIFRGLNFCIVLCFLNIENCQFINSDPENGRETLPFRHEMLRLSSASIYIYIIYQN